MRKISYMNGVLTVIAVLLALLLVDRVSSRDTSLLGEPAFAEPPRTTFVNAADQRKAMITELRKLGQKVEALDRTLTSGSLRVTVIDMPPVKVVEAPAKKGK